MERPDIATLETDADDDIQALCAYVRELEADNSGVIGVCGRQSARITELEVALEPFANVVDGVYLLPPGESWSAAHQALRGDSNPNT